MEVATIRPGALHELRQQGRPIDLIDVRFAFEYRAVHADGARHIPYSEVTPEVVLKDRKAPTGDPIYVICRSGGRSDMICARLAKAGVNNVVNVAGGTVAWERAGLPVVRGGGNAMGRRLRLAGLLAVLAALVLGLAVNPAFLWVAIGLWVVLLVAGRGACPLGACALPERVKES